MVLFFSSFPAWFEIAFLLEEAFFSFLLFFSKMPDSGDTSAPSPKWTPFIGKPNLIEGPFFLP